ncbi:hypothetical protein, partial [Serratia marcescens]|uniref:hypothetical protein n=1 Tax=Serratia marcescens TaxID=615 RepID=UPI0013D9C331
AKLSSIALAMGSGEKFQFYSIFIITFYLHGAMLDYKEADFLEVGSKGLYLLALVAIDVYLE